MNPHSGGLTARELYRILRETVERERGRGEPRVYEYPEEMMLVNAILSFMFNGRHHVVIYEVENFENLFDYATVFLRLDQAMALRVLGRHVRFITIASYPHDRDIADEVLAARDRGFTPVVAYFVGDFLPSGDTASPDYKSLTRALSMALFSKACYVILFTSNPVVLYDNVPLARYGVLVRDFAPRIIGGRYSDKAKYVSTVGFRRVLGMKPGEIAEYLKRRRLPTPHTIEEVVRDITFSELVLPESVKTFLRVNVVNPLRRDFTLLSSLLLIGPAGAGKTTLGYAIARELGVPAYTVRVELMASKWLGETEKMANETLLLVNDRSPAVVIFRDAELILGERRGGGGEETLVFERVRAIISSWLRSEKRRFLAVFTISDPRRVPEYILYDATFGVFKLPILPPLQREHRKALLTLFLSKLARRYSLHFDPLDTSIEEALNTVAEETWAFTPRELQDVARTAVNLVLDRGEKAITKEAIQTARKFKEIDRVARVEVMKETVRACKKVGIPEPLLQDVYRFEEEVEKLKAMAISEEARMRSLARIMH